MVDILLYLDMFYNYQLIIDKLESIPFEDAQDSAMAETVIECLADEYRMHWIDDLLGYDFKEVMRAKYQVDFDTAPYLTPDEPKNDWSPRIDKNKGQNEPDNWHEK